MKIITILTIAAILLLPLSTPAEPIRSDMFPPQPSYRDTYEVSENITITKHYYWDIPEITFSIFFHPFHEDVSADNGGLWKHLSTHEEGIHYNLTTNRYLNYSAIPLVHSYDQPFNLTCFKIAWGNSYISTLTTSPNIPEGYEGGVSSNAEVSDTGLEEGVSVRFTLATGYNESFLNCEFLSEIEVTINFVSTYWYYVFMDFHNTTPTLTDGEILILVIYVTLVVGILGGPDIYEYFKRKRIL